MKLEDITPKKCQQKPLFVLTCRTLKILHCQNYYPKDENACLSLSPLVNCLASPSLVQTLTKVVISRFNCSPAISSKTSSPFLFHKMMLSFTPRALLTPSTKTCFSPPLKHACKKIQDASKQIAHYFHVHFYFYIKYAFHYSVH